MEKLYIYAQIDRYSNTGYTYVMMNEDDHRWEQKDPCIAHPKTFIQEVFVGQPDPVWLATEGLVKTEQDIENEYKRHKMAIETLLDVKAKYLSLPSS